MPLELSHKTFTKRIALLACCFLFSLSFSLNLHAQYSDNDNIILIISSYMSDSKRITDFTFELESYMNNNSMGLDYQILMENINLRGLEDITGWRDEIKKAMLNNSTRNIKGIVLLGQEAWTSFLSLDSIPDVPFFGVYVSKNGVLLPEDGLEDIHDWYPESVDTEALAKSKGFCGAVANIYDVESNVKLILKLFPKTENIVLLTDNTYGGVSIQALVRRVMMEKFPHLNLIELDGRKDDVNSIIDDIDNLPPESALMVGTWRVDNNGLYFLQSTLESLVQNRPTLPIFSLSGLGLGTIAIGGYTPTYSSNVAFIIQSINDYYEGNRELRPFLVNNCAYTFYQAKLDAFGISPESLPRGSTIVKDTETKLSQYRQYLTALMILVVFIIACLTLLFIILRKSMKQTKILRANEKELIDAKERAEESERLKSAFLANMSHEIRTPLNAIVGFSNLICEGNLSKEESSQYISIVTDNSNMLLNLISDILDLSRLESDKSTFNYTEEEASHLCYEAMNSIEMLKKKELEYIVAPGKNPFVFKTDKRRIMQVLINFLSNANKFTKTGSITLSYEVDEDRKCISFAVTDTGCGIPESQTASVFQRFIKLDEFKQGTGLGLSICKQIANKMGGTLYVDNAYKDGARFVYSQPLT